MDKREEDILDDLLDGEESDIDELPVIPETLKGDPKNEKKDDESKLAPELEKMLSKFSDDDEDDDGEKDDNKDKNNKDGKNDKNDKDDKEKIQEKDDKADFMKKVFIIGGIAVLVIILGLLAIWQWGQLDGYIMTFDGEKINVGDFEFYLMMMMNEDPDELSEEEKQELKDETLKILTEYLIIKKAADDRNIVLTQDEKDEIKDYLYSVIEYYGIPWDKLDLSEERQTELFDFVSYGILNNKVINWFIDEYKRNSDDTELELAIENYLKTSKVVRYIITESEEEADEARDTLAVGSMTDIETVMEYSVLYAMMYEGVETNDLQQVLYNLYNNYQGLTISDADIDKVIDPDAPRFSEAFNMGVYGIFMPATAEETEEWLREEHEGHDHGDEESAETEEIFQTELEQFLLNDKLLKYIITESKEKAQEAYNALSFGGMTANEAIMEYSLDYTEAYGIFKLTLNNSPLSDIKRKTIKDMDESEYSDIIAIGPFIIFIDAEDNEVKEYVKSEQGYKSFSEEYEFWQNDIKTEPNKTALNNFDLKKFWDKYFTEG